MESRWVRIRQEEFMQGELPSAWDDVQIEYTNNLISKYDITDFFETGTYFGNTSLYFWKQGLKVHTVELSPHFYRAICVRFTNAKADIEAVLMDSRDFLKSYLIRPERDRTCYYLDAHWRENENPLGGELDMIFDLPRFLTIVHDVSVPDQPQFVPDLRYVEGPWQEYWKNRNHVLPAGICMIRPQYNIPMPYWPWRLNGYCVLVKGYPIIQDDRFTFDEGEIRV